MEELKQAIEDLGNAFHQYKESNDNRIKAIEKGDPIAASDHARTMERIDADIVKFSDAKKALELKMQAQQERIEELEAAADRPRKSADAARHVEYKGKFIQWVRSGGQDREIETELRAMGREAPPEAKAVTIGAADGGGYAVPEEIAREIERQENLLSPVRRLIRVTQVGGADFKRLVNVGGATYGWVGEGDERTETDTSKLRERAPTSGTIYAYPEATEESMDDIFFDVAGWIEEESARAFAEGTGVAVISGNGTKKPTGLLNTAPELTGDAILPARDAAAFQYIVSDTDDGGAEVDPGIYPDALHDTVYALRKEYRTQALWVMNSLTTAAIRKLKDTNGQYLWAPGLAVGQPDALLGYGIETWEHMPDIADGAFPIGFGDWKRAYELIEIAGLRATRDEVTKPGYVKWYIRRRIGGCVTNNHAAKFVGVVG